MAEKSLKERILEDMVVQHKDSVEKNFERAKKLLRLTSTGKVDIIVDKTKLQNNDLVLLYLIGKRYSKEAGLSEVGTVMNQELADELGLPMGSVKSSLSRLRELNKISAVDDGNHEVELNLIDKTLTEIESKLK